MTAFAPYLCISGAASALDFYQKAFGAEVTYPPLTTPDGTVAHAEITIAGSRIMLGDEWPGSSVSPTTLGGSTVSFDIEVQDVEAAVARAVDAGATVLREVSDQFYGYRSGQVTDPFGYKWSLSRQIEQVSPEEAQRRMDAMGG